MRFLAIAFLLIAHPGVSQDTLRLSMLFTGDIMQHDSQIAAAWHPEYGKYDYSSCFQFVKPMLSAPDLTIGNLELTLGGPPYKGYPQFSAPDELLVALKDAGYDVLVTANNHCVDRGRRGLERTIELLDSAGIMHTGTFKDTLDWLNNNPLVISAKGFRISLLNYTYGTNGIEVSWPNLVNRIDTSRIAADLRRASEQRTDLTVVFMHWGKEYESYPNSEQTRLAQFCLNKGARLVIGAHPHVLQSMEWRKDPDAIVVYSLGNFVSGQRDRYKNGGAMLHVDLQKVVQRDSTHTTRIQGAAYSLAWVYRGNDARRTYYILPSEQFESDSTFVRGKSIRESMTTFLNDSRQLYEKENKNVAERKPKPQALMPKP